MSLPIINQVSSAANKIALFRSFFRGREDVYPRRFENRRTKKSGYAPVCGNEWVPGVCNKPKIKCLDCPHRQFLSITDEVIRWHLLGHDHSGRDFVMGIYPMLLDETCFFLAVDFDKKSWQEDAVAFLKTCYCMNLPAALERSRSGNGAHVWLFFAEAISATLARRLGAHIITETMEKNPTMGLDSYDRFFPNQDTLPKGGFGNLIALPLQKKARQLDNSVFVDEHLVAHEDQWAFLAGLRKIDSMEIEQIVERAEAQGKIVGVRLDIPEEENPTPWKKPTGHHIPCALLEKLPKKIELIIGNEIYIDKKILSPSLKNCLIRLAAFQNPEFYKAQAMRLSVHDKPRVISCAHDYPDHLGLPRGCLDDLRQLFSDLKIKIAIQDELYDGEPLVTGFRGQLRPEQELAVTEMFASNIGVLSATTAFGKTVVAAWMIAKHQVNTLVIVHRKQLQDQWIERLLSFLDLPKNTIGCIGGGRKKPTGIIDVAILQSLTRKNIVDDLVGCYGHIIVDECHHLPARSFENVVRLAKARFITGLSATVTRKDGLHPIITMRCGPIRYRVNAKEQAASHPFEHTVLVRPTAFRPVKPPDQNLRTQFQDLYGELVTDSERNCLICDDIIKAVQQERSPLVLTERKEHLDYLAEILYSKIEHLIILRGSMNRKAMAQTMEHLKTVPENEKRVVLATGSFIGEGFDDARLDTLFITLPVSWRGTIAQYVGRLHRLHDLKKEVQVYDYADLEVPMLERMFNRRCKTYESIGYKILLPASASVGWPAAVPLPVDPAWKADYGATVRRLIRDGIDAELATQFTQLACHSLKGKTGVDRARSATEAFLYRRLESLLETAGRFQLNVKLPIPFDNSSSMEVDLLCLDAKVAIEIDGSQHLSDAEAYRRDRRKDLLLQENGYIVLRFLAEDVGKRLDVVLDTILRATSKVNSLLTDRKNLPD